MRVSRPGPGHPPPEGPRNSSEFAGGGHPAERPAVLVAMSGGVDSSVAAALLVRAGYEVVGVTLKLWAPDGGFAESGCCTAGDAADARRVASQLGIDYYVFDFVDSFEEAVVSPFVESYLQGLTPNPCVECNRVVKFDLLMEKARRLGCDYVATGHHARIARRPLSPGTVAAPDTVAASASAAASNTVAAPAAQGGAEPWSEFGREGAVRHVLLRGKDRAKDQSYVLYMLGQDALSRLLFPIGEMTKEEVRATASSLGLRTASKPESQDVCFVGRRSVDTFVAEQSGRRPRLKLVDTLGRRLGTAATGVVTVGQRRGLGLAAGRRLYVKSVDRASGTAVVAPREELFVAAVEVQDFNWVSGRVPESPVRAEVQVRYNSAPTPATLYPEGGTTVRIEFDRPVWAPAPGQVAVAYDRDEVVGGGVISSC